MYKSTVRILIFMCLLVSALTAIVAFQYLAIKREINTSFATAIQQQFPAIQVSHKLDTTTSETFALNIEQPAINGDAAISIGPYFLKCPTCFLFKQTPFLIQNATFLLPPQKSSIIFPNLYGGFANKDHSGVAIVRAPTILLQIPGGTLDFNNINGDIRVTSLQDQDKASYKDLAVSLHSSNAKVHLSCPGKQENMSVGLKDISFLGALSHSISPTISKELETKLLIQKLSFKIPTNLLPLSLTQSPHLEDIKVEIGGTINSHKKPGEISITLFNWKNIVQRMDNQEQNKLLKSLGYKKTQTVDLKSFPKELTLSAHLDGYQVTGKIHDSADELAAVFCGDITSLLEKNLKGITS